MTTTKFQDALLNAWLGWHKKARESGAFDNPSIPFEQGFKAAWDARQSEIDGLEKTNKGVKNERFNSSKK